MAKFRPFGKGFVQNSGGNADNKNPAKFILGRGFYKISKINYPNGDAVEH